MNAAPPLRAKLGALGPTYGALAALVVLVLVNAAVTPNFASANNLWNILLQVSTTVLVATAMTVVIASGGIDLSVGSVMAMVSVVSVSALPHGAAYAIVAGLVAGTLAGVLNGVMVARFGIQPFIATLATLMTGRGVAQVMSHEGELISFDDPAFQWLGRGRLGPVPVQVVITAIVVAVAAFMLRATTFGRHAVAVGGNEAAARLAGIKVQRTRIAVYAASGLLSALAGLIVTARLGTTDAANVGQNMELDAIAAVVVGGTPLSGGRATVAGTIVGALIMAVISTSFNMLLLPYAWSLVVKAAIILLAVFLQRTRRA